MLTEEPDLAHQTKDKDNIVTTDSSKTGFEKTLCQKQTDGELKTIAFRRRFLNDKSDAKKNHQLENSNI